MDTKTPTKSVKNIRNSMHLNREENDLSNLFATYNSFFKYSLNTLRLNMYLSFKVESESVTLMI